MARGILTLTALLGALWSGAACRADRAPAGGAPSDAPSAAARELGEEPGDPDLVACEARWAALERAPAEPGTRELGERRAAFLGRARGAMTYLVRPPRPDESEASKQGRERLAKDLPGTRMTRFVARNKHDRAGLRGVVMREGYLFADQPEDAFELEQRVKLTDLFDEDRLVLDRGEETFTLERKAGKHPEYVFADGPRAGKTATILFLDRVRPEGAAAGPPVHRDVVGLARRVGFDRVGIERATERGLLARLRFGETTARAVLESSGAKLDLACLAEPRAVRDRVRAHQEATAWRRAAEARLRAAVTAQLDDALPFDRPRDEKGPDKDGSLRPHWMSAYLSGRHGFEVDGQRYTVYLPDGRPHPPQVCVDFVLDSYERAAGGWFRPRGEKPARIRGALSFADYETQSRGVIGFGQFAEKRAELFDVRRFEGAERIPFGRRDDFFRFLSEHAHEFRAGDVLAIQGLKRDDRVHQHAILLEEVDPLTGFPAAMADQMKVPRRRTWEGIMGEAPKRSLLYRARPRDVIVQKLGPGL